MADAPVLTIFAGPNGSGKSTLKKTIAAAGLPLGPFINADEIAAAMRHAAKTAGRTVAAADIEHSAFLEAERRRQTALAEGKSFSFETVFSHPSKLDFIAAATLRAFQVRLYFVSTENSLINVARVQVRVARGGHDVPVDKIIARYRRTMSHLAPACLQVDEAFLFDNSTETMRLTASMDRRIRDAPKFRFEEPLPTWIIAWGEEMAALLKRSNA